MRRRITWRSAAAISMLGLAPGIGAAFAVPAGASTYACGAALGTQCGTFTESAAGQTVQNLNMKPPSPPRSGDRGGLGWAVRGASTALNTPLIEGPNYSPGNDPATDLTKVEHYGPIPGSQWAASGYWYSIVYTPYGRWTSMCVSNPNNMGRDGENLVLRPCNKLKWQAFLAIKPTPRHHGSPSTVGARDRLFLPSAPTWWAPTSSVPIPNLSSTSAYALYSMANGEFVEATRSHGFAADSDLPGRRALSATGHSGEPATNTNSWFWTNANGTGPGPRPHP